MWVDVSMIAVFNVYNIGLHYYRNLKTVRTKFNILVHPGSVQSDVPCDASEGLTVEIWKKYKINTVMLEHFFLYFHGLNKIIIVK